MKWICNGAGSGKFWEAKWVLGGNVGEFWVLAGSGNSSVVLGIAGGGEGVRQRLGEWGTAVK